MILNIFIALIMFIPFYVALLYKHSTTITKVMVFLWCLACCSMMYLITGIAFIGTLLGYEPQWQIIASVVGWGLVDIFIPMKIIFDDKPKSVD